MELSIFKVDSLPRSVNKSLNIAAKDSKEVTHTVSPSCTHMGCLVSWNDAEESWDCPCHGSRFEADGTLIHGPALEDLEKKPIG